MLFVFLTCNLHIHNIITIQYLIFKYKETEEIDTKTTKKGNEHANTYGGRLEAHLELQHG